MLSNPDGCYGSGKRVIDESKAASCRDSIAAMIATAGALDEYDPMRWEIEGRIGREAIRLAEIEKRLA
jgi:hypothetical protein